MIDYDFSKIRMYSVLIGICFIFSLFVMNAYKFLPKEDASYSQNDAEQNLIYSPVNNKEEKNVQTEPEDEPPHVDSNEDVLRAIGESNDTDYRENYSYKQKLKYSEKAEEYNPDDYDNEF